MAHDKCIGTWEKSKLGGDDDGKIRVDDHSGNTFTGEHLKTGAPLKETSCDGTKISFSREDKAASERVSYSGSIVPDGPAKVKISGGRFVRKPIIKDSVKGDCGGSDSSEDQPDLPDDWESEKVT